MTQDPNRADSSRRSSLVARLVVAAVFLVMFVGVSVWLFHKYALQPQTVIIPPLEVAQDRQAPPGQPVQPPRATAPRPRPANGLPNLTTPTFTGTVVDAQTHLPVPAFAALIGIRNSLDQSPISFMTDPQSPAGFTRGQYTVTPVSYTHLDVYKRQAGNRPRSASGSSRQRSSWHSWASGGGLFART